MRQLCAHGVRPRRKPPRATGAIRRHVHSGRRTRGTGGRPLPSSRPQLSAHITRRSWANHRGVCSQRSSAPPRPPFPSRNQRTRPRSCLPREEACKRGASFSFKSLISDFEWIGNSNPELYSRSQSPYLSQTGQTTGDHVPCDHESSDR
jgi:hypothetical protein